MTMPANTTITIGNTEYLSVIIPLNIFDRFEKELAPLFIETDPGVIDKYRKVLDDMKDVVGEQFYDAGMQLIECLIERWNLLEEGTQK